MPIFVKTEDGTTKILSNKNIYAVYRITEADGEERLLARDSKNEKFYIAKEFHEEALNYCRSFVGICEVKMADFQIEDGVLVKYLGNNVHVDIPPLVTEIGEEAFCDCKDIYGVFFPYGLKTIGDYAFCNCVHLNDIHIPDTVTKIGKSAFSMCSALKKIDIPDSVTGEIGPRTFFCCESLNYVTVGKGITSIGEDAFRECSALCTITIYPTVTHIDEGAFNGAAIYLSIRAKLGSYARKYAKKKGFYSEGIGIFSL